MLYPCVLGINGIGMYVCLYVNIHTYILFINHVNLNIFYTFVLLFIFVLLLFVFIELFK